MIDDRDRIFARLRSFDWKPGSRPFEDKLARLDSAITAAVKEIGEQFDERVHLSYSGGVDSTFLLYRFLKLGFPVTAHTMAGGEQNVDLVHARRVTSELGGDLQHKVYIVETTAEDTAACNDLLRGRAKRPDNYYLLMRAVSAQTDRVVGGDCIDELLGGYYPHRGGEAAVFRAFLDKLITGHLHPLDLCSTAHGVRVHLPYAAGGVLQACRSFHFFEMVDPEQRKKPICELARRASVPEGIIGRRKRGLVSALDTAVPS